MKKIIFLFLLILIVANIIWYFDLLHKDVETINELIGKRFSYTYKTYFQNKPYEHYQININNELNEFDGGIYNSTSKLTDSIVQVYTWKFRNYQKTIWVGKTKQHDSEIIDAIRYKNYVRF